jgi:hypothetical protein
MSQVYEIVLGGQGPGGNFFANVLHYEVVEDAPDTPFKVATGMIPAWLAENLDAYAAILPNNVVFRNALCRRVTGEGGNAASLPVAQNGTVDGEGACNGVGADIAFIADGGPPRSIGHLYTPAVAPNDLVDGDFTSTFGDNVTSLATHLLTELTWAHGSANLVIFTRGEDPIWHTVTNVELRPKPVLMNRRLRPIV